MMKKSIMIIMAIILFLTSYLIFGCDTGPVGVSKISPSSSPSPNPTDPTGNDVVLAEGRTNTYDLAISGSYIYWTEKVNGGGVYRTKADGTGPVEPVATGYTSAYSLCIVGNNLYFTDKIPGGKIIKVDLSDPNFSTMDYVTGLNQALWIRYANGYLYWTAYESPTNSHFYRVKEGESTAQTANIKAVAKGLQYPFAFFIDPVTKQVVLTEIAGSSSRILWFVIPGNEANFPVSIGNGMFEVYSGIQSLYGTGICYDTSVNKIYWCNFSSNSGVFRIEWDPIKQVVVGNLEVVETGLAQAFDIFRPISGCIFYSLNTSREENGNIYYDDINNLTKPSKTDIINSSINYPFRFLIDAGAYYWTEYPYFFAPDGPDSGGGPGRVMKNTH